jgi:hypothetical protein
MRNPYVTALTQPEILKPKTPSLLHDIQRLPHPVNGPGYRLPDFLLPANPFTQTMKRRAHQEGQLVPLLPLEDVVCARKLKQGGGLCMHL